MPELGKDGHERFAQEYMLDLNPGEAAKRAGYSAHTCGSQGRRLLHNARIASRVAELKAERAERLQISQDRVIQEVAAIAFANLKPLISMSPLGDPSIDLSAATNDQFAALSTIKVDDYVDGRGDAARDVKSVELKSHDKLKALDMLGKHLGVFKEKVELTLDDDVATQLAKAMARHAAQRAEE